MDSINIYASGRPPRQIDVDSMLESISDQVLSDGNVEKALQRSFRFGTEDEMGLLDILDRLREEISDAEHHLQEPDQHDLDMEAVPAERKVEDAIAMREALRQVESLDDLQGVDPELMERALSSEELEWVEKWSEMTGQMIDSGLVAMSGQKLTLTAKAIRQIGSRLLQHMFLPPTKRGKGNHHVPAPGLHGMAGDESSEWEWGKPLDLNIARSLTNAVRRTGQVGKLQLQVNDFEVFERESGAAVHTVLLMDMSRSMFDSGAWDAAKRAAVALNTLITTSRMHDELDLVGFSGDARKLNLDELPQLSWDQFSHGTNLHAGFLVAARMLRRNHSLNRQIAIITDGEPTAHMDGPNPVFEHPVTERTFNATLLEAKRLSRQGVSFTTICVGEASEAPEFAQTLSHTVNGRMILLPLDELGAFVVRDVSQGTFRTVR